jgi:hypothetical protein
MLRPCSSTQPPRRVVRWMLVGHEEFASLWCLRLGATAGDLWMVEIWHRTALPCTFNAILASDVTALSK